MINFEVRRNRQIVAVLTGMSLPDKGTRLVFADNEYEVIVVKRFYQNDMEMDLPQIHVNHVRVIS